MQCIIIIIIIIIIIFYTILINANIMIYVNIWHSVT